MVEQIMNKLDKAISNLDNENFLELFPTLLDDLEYVIKGSRVEEESLDIGAQFMHGSEIRMKKNEYLAKLSQLYFRLKYKMNLVIEKMDSTGLGTAGGGYSEKDDKMYYSEFGSILNRTSELSFLHTCLHEGRHKMQHDAYKSTDILSFPPYMLKMLKEAELERSLKQNNREFYQENYETLFTENDPEIFAKQEISSFINYLTELYVELCDNAKQEDEVIGHANRINVMFGEILKSEEFRVNEMVEMQIYRDAPAHNVYKISGITVDRIIVLDKFIKTNPQLQEKYPILRLLFNGNTPKTYEEIINDKEEMMRDKTPEEQQRIEELYAEVIYTDPILYITDNLEKGNNEVVEEFISTYTSIPNEYQAEVAYLREKYGTFGPKTL